MCNTVGISLVDISTFFRRKDGVFVDLTANYSIGVICLYFIFWQRKRRASWKPSVAESMSFFIDIVKVSTHQFSFLFEKKITAVAVSLPDK